MRLLYFNDAGHLCLTGDIYDKKIPQYAILSHVWSKDEDEISFADLMDGPDTNKSGYIKIKSCGEQARNDGINYFWVDTCCIDKRSSAELSEAIDSMFEWYKKAQACYAYLSDVPHSQRSHDGLPAFRKSGWFRRGWTLQELLAPREVRFFDQDWQPLWTKSQLAGEIEIITGIPMKVLDGTESVRSERLSVTQRMSWAAKRKTSRVEDTAYCLMEIFDVNMLLLYGEGKKSLLRLQEEIMKVSTDETIFTWHCCYDYIEEGFNTLLAPHPACFAMCSDVVFLRYTASRSQGSKPFDDFSDTVDWRSNLEEPRLPFMMTNRGLQISTRLYSMPELQDHDRNSKVMVLNCRRARPDSGVMALILWDLVRGYSVQDCVELPNEVFKDHEIPPLETIYLLRLRV